MKKLFIAALIVLAAGSTAFATDATKVNNKIKTSFSSLFANAENVSWTITDQFTRANFILDEENVEAYFSKDGDLIGTSVKIDFKKLPSKALKTIKKEYGSYKVTDCIEFQKDDSSTYYVSLEDGNKKQILEVSLFGAVSVYKGAAK